ncbi:MAG: anthranilate synthase component I family protein [Acidobacteriaceae bacterium]|nr:anthranilate synthase component I family protein [Acidobacteriaceae bacterium]
MSSDNLWIHLTESIQRTTVEAPPLPFPFLGGYIGYLGYEMKGACNGPNNHRSSLPDAIFLLADRFLVIDHQENALWLAGCAAHEDLGDIEQWIAEYSRWISELRDDPTEPVLRGDGRQMRFRVLIPKQEYLRRIAKAQAYIAAGESYEICLTNKLYLRTEIPALTYYQNLRALNPAPYAAYLSLGDVEIACSSPECFLRIAENGSVESRPIKGTLPRGQSEAEDLLLRSRLAADEKYRAENLMITDLVRHDIGRVCGIGTVRVPQLMKVETYATVHQLVSTLTGKLSSEASPIDCIRAAFPAGSMTGAPKLRTLELLDGLEDEARGIYSGNIGYIGFNRTADLNVVIRSAVFNKQDVSIGVGGAITFQSEAEQEWAEIMLKAKALLSAFSAAPRAPDFE